MMNPHAFPPDLDLQPEGRWPTTLSAATVRAILDRPLPDADPRLEEEHHSTPPVSIVIVTFDNLVFTRLCLESILAQSRPSRYEVVVVDNGSSDGTPEYLLEIARRQRQIHTLFNDQNRGFAAATNQGLGVARGHIVILLNNDTMVTPGWMASLGCQLRDPSVGLVGPVTNWSHNETQIDTTYRTFDELLRFVGAHVGPRDGMTFEVDRLAMFCCAARRDLWSSIGPLDERFGIGMFEDTDYAMRVRRAGYRIVCAEGAFVHHFGQASIGKLLHDGTYHRLFEANRNRLELKWKQPWHPPHRRLQPDTS